MATDRILYEEGGVRVVDNPITGIQRQNALLTTFVLTMSSLADDTFSPGYKLFPELDVPKYNFSFPVSQGEELVPIDAVRGYGATIRTVRYAQKEQAAKLVRNTLQGVVDDDEILNEVSPYDAAGKAALIARKQLMAGLEYKKAQLVATDANYGTVITLTTGNGWSQQSDSLYTVVGAAATALENAIGIDRSNFSLALFGTARQAAKGNEALRAQKAFTGGVYQPTLQDVASFLDLKEVWGSNRVYKPTMEAAAVSMYPDDAVLYYPGNPSRQATLTGDRAWGKSFTLGPGVALEPYRVPEATSTYYPWQKRESTYILDPSCAVRIKNPAGV